MASNGSPGSESLSEIDFSVIRTSIQMNHTMIDQILHGIHYGSEEVRSLLREECDFILECKVCRNMFRSFPNFVAHKRVFCSETYEETVQKMPTALNSARDNVETVVVHPDDPNDPSKKPIFTATESTIESVIDTTFDGKSKEYQFYTKVAEDLEREKLTKATKTIVINSIPTNRNAVVVTQSDGDNAEQVIKEYKEQQEKKKEERARRIARKNRTIAEVCRELAKKGKTNQENFKQNEPVSKRVSMRCRKSSPRKSMDYVTEEDKSKNDKSTKKGNKNNDTVDNTDGDDNEWTDLSTFEPVEESDYCSKKWMKFADLNDLECRVCKRVFSSLQGLKFHVKSKHMGQGPCINCPVCTNVYDNFNKLAKHLKQHHHMSDSMIYNIRMKKTNLTISKKSPEKMETDEEHKTDKTPNSDSGKKCDKCLKIFWKARSFTRHLPCKGSKASNKATTGPQGKPTSSNATLVEKEIGNLKETPSPKKSPSPLSRGVAHSPSSVETVYMNSETKIIIKNPSKELLQLQEKLRAKALTPGTGNVIVTGNSHKEKETTTKTATAKKETTGGSKILYKVLTSPFQKVPPKLADMKRVGESMVEEMDKSKAKAAAKKLEDQPGYSLRASKTDKESIEKQNTDKGIKQVSKDTIKTGKGSNKESPCKDSLKTTKEIHKDPPKTRASSSEKGGLESGNKNSNEFKKLEERLTREAGISELDEDYVVNESNAKSTTKPAMETDNDTTSRNDKQKVLLKSPNKNDLATLELQELQIKLTRKIMGPSNSGTPIQEKEMSDIKVGKTVTVENDAETFVEPRTNTRARSPERVKKVAQEKISEVKGKAGISSEVEKETVAGKRHFRSVSQGAEPVSRYGERTPEKVNFPLQASPVISRRQSFPTSPTPSLNSNSGDGFKFKMMSVKEMAELVESASLTKFAKERKKKAKTFLTKKQARDTQKVAPILSKPIRKRKTNRKIVVRNVYETRRSGVSKALRMSGAGTSKRLLLEQKRLQDSAGFVPENFYDSSRSKDAKKETEEENSGPSKSAGSIGGAKEMPEGHGKNKEKAATDDPTNTRNQKEIPSQSSKIVPHTSSSRESSNERSRSREMKNLANSAGFVEKNYYSATSVDSRDRSRSNESARSQIKGKDSESDSDKKINNRRTNAQVNAIKGLSDSTGNESDDSVGRMSRNRTRMVPLTGEIQHRLRNVSDSSTESKDRNKVRTGANKFGSPEETAKGHVSDSAESGVSVTEKREKREIRKVNKDDLSGKIQTRHTVKTIDDASKHRTRLSTGSIYFDSELLKLSPTKIEKKLAEAKKDQENEKEKQIRAATCKKLNLSPRKIVPKSSQIKPGFYPMSTGIKQCPKCQRRFWKKKAYDFHMQHVCRDGMKSKVSRKRILSLSPKGKSADEKETSETTPDAANKKAKLDIEATELEKSNKGVRTVGKSGNKKLVTNKETDTPKSPKKASPAKSDQSKVKETQNDKSDESSEMEIQSPIFTRTLTRSSDKSPAKGKERADLEKVGKGQVDEQTKQGEASDNSESERNVKTKTINARSTRTVIETKNDVVKGLTEADKTVEDKKTGRGVSEKASEKIKADNEIIEAEERTNAQNENVKGRIKTQTEETKGPNENTKTQNQNKNDKNQIRNRGIDNTEENVEHGQSDKVKTGESATSPLDDFAQPGPSGLNTSQGIPEAESDDENDSDFSGFSEDDLKTTEEELSAHLNVSGKDLEHRVELEDGDLSDLGDLELSSDDDLDLEDERSEVTADNIDPNSKRPVRKSAQNRFSHVEEIWVYKEPGKPVRMRHQTPETREYVVDVNNAATILCHNSKDIDRLVDEGNLKCKQCDSPCKSISNLRRHVIRHLGWKRFKCLLCTFACYDKSRISIHQLRVHDVRINNGNFSEYVTDLKKEATKLRAEKRTSTMRSAKKRPPSAADSEYVYQKPKTSPPVVKMNKLSPKDDKGDEKLPSPSQSAEAKTSDLLSKARASLSKALK